MAGQWGGTTYAVAVQGRYAYVGEGACLAILDLANPATPVEVGKTRAMPGIVRGVAVAGKYAYLAIGQAGGLPATWP
jgi:hypothetical protein